ncbi:hypothetical protein [Tunturiibacter gelidoferens]|uniref:Transmembrane protein n=1 Tax=Tunturiibacter gelidiferens TaxID=3069689 RepID=A0A9X0QB67_9BACT|nr:hypothetical protein [Edaphobacter lichenicola]MBB5327221.1 hypothetical protein [Edaphobacter lichenicola]
MFMRVRRTVPQFTFSLSARFVNSLSSVSTGFFRFFSVLFENRYIFLISSEKIQVLAAKNSAINPRSHRIFALAIAVAFVFVFVFLVVIPAGDLLLPLSLLSSSPFSIQQKPRHLDRGCSQFHREQRSGETPHSLPLYLCLYSCRFVFVKIRRPNRISSLRINL